MKTIYVINKKTGERTTAQYSRNRLGNRRMWVDNKFYSDREFDRKYKIDEVIER